MKSSLRRYYPYQVKGFAVASQPKGTPAAMKYITVKSKIQELHIKFFKTKKIPAEIAKPESSKTDAIYFYSSVKSGVE